MSLNNLASQKHPTWLRKKAYKTILVIMIFSFFLVSCSTGIFQPGNTQQSIPTLPYITRTSTASPTETPLPSPTTMPTQAPILVWLPDYLPEKMRSEIVLPQGYNQAASPESADISFHAAADDESPSSHWVYALVAPFPTITDGVSGSELRLTWGGNYAPAFDNTPLLMDESTLEILSVAWGEPASGVVQVVARDDLRRRLWRNAQSGAFISQSRHTALWRF